jgi:hypothetical protein
MKLEDIKGKLQESKFVVQTLDQHIVKVEKKFEHELNYIINLNNFKLQVDKDTYLTIKEVLILHIFWQLEDKDWVVDVVHNQMCAYHTLLEEEDLTWTTWTSMDYTQEANYKLFLGINGTLSNRETPLSTTYQNIS